MVPIPTERTRPPVPHMEEVYQVGDVLGKGSFSTVRLGEEVETGAKVALKIIPAHKYRHSDRAKHLISNEVAVMTHLSRLNHPNLMQFFHHFEDPEKVVMVLEYLSGGQLFDRIVQKGHYSEQDASKLTRVLVCTLQAMHSVGILHRDLKPENCVYLTPAEDSILKLTDFGLSAFTAAADKTMNDRHLVGTPNYLCPYALTTRTYSPASDVWAAGVILFILLSGTPPFWGKTHEEIFTKIKHGRWSFRGKTWDSISPQAKDLVLKMMKQDPAQRITAEEVLQHPWIKLFQRNRSEHLGETIAELKKFNAKQKFRGAALACIAGNRMQRLIVGMKVPDEDVEGMLGVFTAEELKKLKEEFTRAVQGKDSQEMTLTDFKRIMEKLKMDHLPLDRIFSVFDTDGNGHVDYKEFLLGLSKFRLQGDEAIKFCFDVLDEDKSGTISREELAKVLAHHRRAQVKADANEKAVRHLRGADMDYIGLRSASMDPDAYEFAESVVELFESLDKDGDDQVSLQEFLDGMKRHPEIVDVFFHGGDDFKPSSSSDFTTTLPAAAPQNSVVMKDA